MNAASRLCRFALVCLLVSLATVSLGQPSSTEVGSQGKNVTNVFAEADLRQALADVASQAEVVIVADATVQGTISAELKDVPLEKALRILLAVGGFSYRKMEDFYLVGLATPGSPSFAQLTDTTVIRLRSATAEELFQLLPEDMLPFVRADKTTNSIVITASEERARAIRRTVESLDTTRKQVVLEAMVTEVSDTRVLDQGFSWSWGRFGSDAAQNLLYTSASRTDLALLKSLITNGDAELKASPRVMAQEGKEAQITIGTESYFSIVTGPTNFPYTTLQQIKTGITLKFVPYINAAGEISARLEANVSDAIGTGANGLPVNTVRTATTTLTMRDGDTIVIGGLRQRRVQNSVSKVPILGYLPILGELFTRRSKEEREGEVVITITAKVVTNNGG